MRPELTRPSIAVASVLIAGHWRAAARSLYNWPQGDCSGTQTGTVRSLDAVMTAAKPFHPAIRVMRHAYAGTFALSRVPTAIVDAADCAARARGQASFREVPPEYGRAFGMTIRFLTCAGDAPVLRMLWRRENGAWRITAYDVEMP